MNCYRMMGLVLALSLACLVGVAQAESVNMIPNGSFDAGVDGWTGGGCWWYQPGSLLIYSGPAWLISPTFTTPVVAGETYKLSFDAWTATSDAPTPGEQSTIVASFSNAIAPLEAQLTNAPQTFSYTYTAPVADNGLNQMSFLNNLSYQAGHTPAGAPYMFALDNVSLTAVPEPASLVLSAIGMLGLLAYAWRKR